jgi:hypothetical protein
MIPRLQARRIMGPGRSSVCFPARSYLYYHDLEIPVVHLINDTVRTLTHAVKPVVELLAASRSWVLRQGINSIQDEPLIVLWKSLQVLEA